MSERPRLYLIDGFSNVFRAFYAIRNLSNRKGEATNAVFGFLQMLRKLLRDEQPTYVGVALDTGRATVRSERFEAYKANRKPMPEDLRPQIPWIRKVIEAFRIPILEVEKYEADDVIGTLATKAVAEGFDVVLVSPDKDLMQLVGEHVVQLHTGRDARLDIDGVTEVFGVPPSQVVDVLALMGDASDNVPGVPGIGEKGAKNLIAEYGSLDALLDRADEVKRKSYREGLQQHRDKAELSKELVTIHTDLPIALEPAALIHEEPDIAALIEICDALDFDALRKELESAHPQPVDDVPPAEEALDAAAWDAATRELVGEIGVGLVSDGAHEVGLVVATPDLDGDGEASVFADFRRDGLRGAALDRLAAWAADPTVTLFGHDLKEVLRLLPASAPVACNLIDTMLLSYLTQPARHAHTLDDSAFDLLRHQPMKPAEVGWGKGMEPLVGESRLLGFAAERVVLPRRFGPTLRSGLDGSPLAAVYDDIEAPLLPVLLRMEERGITLDTAFLADMSVELGTSIDALETEIYDLAGERFNIASPQQLGVLMFEKLGYPVLRRTRKTKNYATGADTLEELAARGYPLPEVLLRFRELTKLRSTYVDALPTLVADDGRIHTRFNQAVAVTGRLSSAHPNLQNIPTRTPDGQRIRKAFVAAPGHRLIVADYSQIELRVLAHIAQDEALIEAFRQGEDIHAATAAAMFGGSPMLVNPDQRRMAKVINFGIIYGMSSWGLAQRLGLERGEAKRFIDTYFEKYPGVARYMEETLESVQAEGKVETLFGRVRWLPDITSRNHNLRENAKRMAINARIQGTAADLLKMAMIAVDRRLERDHPGAHLLLTVHDELVVEAPEAAAADVGKTLESTMEGIYDLGVPLVVDAGQGETWYDAKS